ncbi:alpha/beta-hydrolase [Biscogniauxia mediterranea]|nr:alpha/beta-hydrolase [Biscogniauxia mediterranea]
MPLALSRKLPTSSQRVAAVATATSDLVFHHHKPQNPSSTFISTSSFFTPGNNTPVSRPLTHARTTACCTQAHHRSLFQQFIPGAIANMSTMPAQHGHSVACCNIPPVVAKGYSAKGTYEELGGYKTYITGPQEATKGIIVIFDIFGYFPQTLQGADILATASDAQKYKVFIPDWFHGEPCPIEWFPPDNEDKKKKLGAFFQKNSPPSVAAKVPDYAKAVSAKYPEIKDWAILGYCWGGKVVSLVTSNPDTVFKAGVECHPAMVDPADAAKIKVPLALLASKDENPADVEQFEKNLTGPKHVETFPDQIHGWMAARSNLEDERVKAEYVRGYETVLKFLAQYV